jgi:uncharacterized protein (TIGR02246 family)
MQVAPPCTRLIKAFEHASLCDEGREPIREKQALAPRYLGAKEAKVVPAKTPEQCDELFGKYVNARDLDNLVGYEVQASLVNEDGTAARGTAAIRETMQGLFAALPEGKITMKVVRLVRAGDDLAVLYNDWSMVGKAADGSPFAMQHKAMEIVRRQSDGTWRFAVDDPYARG